MLILPLLSVQIFGTIFKCIDLIGQCNNALLRFGDGRLQIRVGLLKTVLCIIGEVDRRTPPCGYRSIVLASVLRPYHRQA